MQYHLNGFRSGDPELSGPQDGPQPDAPAAALPAEVDVLIVGSGPTGLTLAAQLAAFPGITTRIIEQKTGPLRLGQADGIACRTMEMFEAFGFCEKVLKEAYWVNETTFWRPDAARPGAILRSGRIQDTEDGLSEFPHVILNQARVHDFFLDTLRKAPAGLIPDYDRQVTGLSIETAPPGGGAAPSHPVTVTVAWGDPEAGGTTETVRARYVIGCDGARSVVRKAIGRELHGEAANQAWGVMDVLVVTDFPDIRLKTAIHSATEGSLLIIPREGGYLVRLYIELDKLNENERVASRNLTVDYLIVAAQRILRPYTLAVKEVAWWSVYDIGQRLCDRFDDVADADTGLPRVFIAGDACHTHSPKAGQGMNMSMQDSFSLGWKLASVLQGRASAAILRTYSQERHAIAQELIDFDRELAKMFSARPKEADDPDGEGIDPAEFQKYFVQHGRFTAGTATRYRPSLITGTDSHQALATGFPVGMRFHSAPVVRLADARPLQLGHVVKADGRWRLFAFADAAVPTAPGSRLRALCDFLAAASQSPLRRYTPAGADIDTVIDVRAVLQQPHRQLALDGLPAVLLPRKGKYGLIDYEKAFCPDLSGRGDIFDLRGIDRARGCMVLVRPDQYIAHVLPLDAADALCAFFDGFMLSPA
ncbi:MAG: 3-hydroxybenzoate 4-monooxygenase [Rhodobacteraceae bacterium]|nr:3-hydroxybenzoate 4-monooxygenase [Paracoccaceae bacterium]